MFVLTDDLAWNLVRKKYMPHVIELQRHGITFKHYFVADSLCCPSRSSIFTGLFPHDTGVLGNAGSNGGYGSFQTHHDQRKTYPLAIRPRRYWTSFLGKYLNGYGSPKMTMVIPPGWSDWTGAGNAYAEFNYNLNENGRVVHYGGRSHRANYLTDVLARRATKFIDRAAVSRKRFVMEVATFAPHAPYTPAPRNAHDFHGLKAPRKAAFDKNNFDPPLWLGVRPPLTQKQIHTIDRGFRKRAQSVEAVDRMIGKIEDTLRAHGLASNTYIFFSSDNGYHMGEHRLLPGKQTAFDTDIRVPLIVAGPGVPHDRVESQVVQNVDLYPTFLELAGVVPRRSVDGHSIVPLLHPAPGRHPLLWRTAALIEHQGPDMYIGDPDLESGNLSGNPTTYRAVRLAGGAFGNALYVEYSDPAREREFYDIDADPGERYNIYYTPLLTPSERVKLHAMVAALSNCHGAKACWKAGQPH